MRRCGGSAASSTGPKYLHRLCRRSHHALGAHAAAAQTAPPQRQRQQHRWGKTRCFATAAATATQDEEEFSFSIQGQEIEGRAVYLDAQATTPMDPRVVDAMLPYMTYNYGNPHSRTHAYGWDSEAAIEAARQQVASLCGADAKEIVFTSGATESNNASIKGIGRFYKARGKTHIITTTTEHKCV
jgi:cysteine desulfurase